MSALRLAIGAVSVGLFIGALFSSVDAMNAQSEAVASVLYNVAVLGFASSFVLATVALCTGERKSAYERDLARRTRNELLRIRSRNKVRAAKQRAADKRLRARGMTRAW